MVKAIKKKIRRIIKNEQKIIKVETKDVEEKRIFKQLSIKPISNKNARIIIKTIKQLDSIRWLGIEIEIKEQ